MKKLLIYLLLCCSFMGSQAAIQPSISFANAILNGEEAGGIMFSRRRNAPTVETMTVEGRMWWYEIGQVYSGTSVARSEIGLTINGTKEIDGKNGM